MEKARKVKEAWQLGKALFAEHLQVLPVQKLRCDLASKLGGSYDEVRRECDPYMKASLPSWRKEFDVPRLLTL